MGPVEPREASTQWGVGAAAGVWTERHDLTDILTSIQLLCCESTAGRVGRSRGSYWGPCCHPARRAWVPARVSHGS